MNIHVYSADLDEVQMSLHSLVCYAASGGELWRFRACQSVLSF